MRPGRLAAPDGLPAGRSGSVRRAAGQHRHAGTAVAPQNKGTDHALGRSRGGFGTQIYVLADRRGRPLRLRVTGGPRHDRTQARALVEAWTGAPRPCLMADRAYDGDTFRAWRAQRGTEAVIPARKGRTNSPTTRNRTRRAMPWHGASAGSRGGGAWLPADQYAHRCLGFLYLAGAWIWLQSYLHTT